VQRGDRDDLTMTSRAEIDNVRAALDFAVGTARWDLALAVAGGSWHWWWILGAGPEGRQRIASVVAGVDAAGESPVELVEVLLAGAHLAVDQSDLDDADRLVRRAIDLAATNGMTGARAEGWIVLSRIHRFRGELTEAKELAECAARSLEGSGDCWRCGMAAHNLGALAEYEGDAVSALEHYRSAAAWMGRLGNRRQRAVILGDIGGMLTALGRPTEVVAALDEALRVAEEFGDQHGQAALTARLGTAHYAAGNLTQAEEMLTTALGLARRAHQRQTEWVVLHSLADCAAFAGSNRRAGNRLLEALAINDDIDFTPGVARCLTSIAALAAREGEVDMAVSLAAAAQALRERDGSQTDDPSAEQVIAAARATIPADRARTAHERGRHWSRGEVIAGAGATVAAWTTTETGVGRAECRDRSGLTPREREVAELLRSRQTDLEIATALHISVRTVTTHVSAVLRKLAVPSRRDVDGALRRLESTRST
jgi:DNA-binding NarL/FixJ family response regulator